MLHGAYTGLKPGENEKKNFRQSFGTLIESWAKSKDHLRIGTKLR
jgi:hypothetical protein